MSADHELKQSMSACSHLLRVAQRKRAATSADA
jgi:hypothetical protein